MIDSLLVIGSINRANLGDDIDFWNPSFWLDDWFAIVIGFSKWLTSLKKTFNLLKIPPENSS